jgi:hypothetical protein
VARKKSRQTFEKLKREQAVKERRARKQERREAARLAKGLDAPPDDQRTDDELAEPATDG